MNANIRNGLGRIYEKPTPRRSHKSYVTYRGVDLTVEYLEEGTYLSATETDPAEFPIANVKAVFVGEQEITGLFGESMRHELEELVESTWK